MSLVSTTPHHRLLLFMANCIRMSGLSNSSHIYKGLKFHAGDAINKSELVAKIAKGAELTKAQAEKALNSFIADTISALKAGDKITLVGFGTFSAVTRAARTGRNPQTGKDIKIAAKTNGKFTPGKALTIDWLYQETKMVGQKVF
jgi:DNA-binding protein HU-beta